MSYTCFEIEQVDRVAHVRLCRPDQLNTMTPDFWRELPEVVREISDRGEARVIVLSSTGRHFSAGMDLAVFAAGSNLDELVSTESSTVPTEVGRVRANLRLNVLHLQAAVSALEEARMPVIAAIHGGCIGGAVDLVCAADMRYATEDAFLCIQEINIGMTADLGTLQRLPKLIPEGIAREYAYTGRRLPAARAYELGLVNGVFGTHTEMLDGVHAIAAEIASRSPLAVWGSKEMITYARDHSVRDGLNYIATWQAAMFHATDMVAEFEAKAAGEAPRHLDLGPVRRGLG
jgi:enoyl-CoA hydratase